METIVLVIPSLNVKVDVQKIKKNIHNYVGNRMVKEEPKEMPGLILKGLLEEEDKKVISDLSLDCGVIFIQYNDEDSAPEGDYFTFDV